MQKLIRLAFFGMALLYLVACSREYSFEGAPGSPVNPASPEAKGTLADSMGVCQMVEIRGSYQKDSALTASNELIVAAMISTPGKYNIYSDTVNGCWFSDTGTVTITGLQKFTLKGYGRPATFAAAGFQIHFDNSVCSFILPAQTAVYVFDAPPGNCPNLEANGIYYAGARLSPSDTVSVPVKVSVPGNFELRSESANGMTFSAKGLFPAAGSYRVNLAGEGVPAQQGATTVPLSISRTRCGFNVNVIYDSLSDWSVNVEGETFSGFIITRGVSPAQDTGTYSGLYPANKVFGPDFYGVEKQYPAQSFFQLDLHPINHPVTPGQYHPVDLGSKDFMGALSISVYPPGQQARTWNTTPSLPTFTIDLETYDTLTGIVRGSSMDRC